MEHKEQWICHSCRSNLPKTDNSNTPARPLIGVGSSNDRERPCAELPVQESNNNLDDVFVTQRRKTSKHASDFTKNCFVDSSIDNFKLMSPKPACSSMSNDMAQEILFIREQIMILNERLNNLVSSVEVAHIKQDLCNDKLMEIDERLQDHGHTITNCMLCSCTCHKNPETNDIAQPISVESDVPTKSEKSKAHQKRKVKKPNTPPVAKKPELILPLPPAPILTPADLPKTKPVTADNNHNDIPYNAEKFGPESCCADELLDPNEIETSNSNEWTEVRYKRRNNQLSLRCTAGPEVTFLKAIEPRKSIHLWNMESEAADVLRYLQNLWPGKNCSVEELKARGDYKSYKITVPEEIYEKCISSEIWPINARVKTWMPFRGPRKNFQRECKN